MSQRRAGILCHITSIPNDSGPGDFGKHTYQFIDLLSSCGFSVWQILPMGPTHADLSPYLSLSAHAGNQQLIDLSWLQTRGWLTTEDINKSYLSTVVQKNECLKQAYLNFKAQHNAEEYEAFNQFKQNNAYWLDDYALYMTLREMHSNTAWNEWPTEYRDYQTSALKEVKQTHQASIESIQFHQYVFFTQWEAIKNYANERDIIIIGDIPIFVSYDSAEVWAKRKYFALGENGKPQFVAGVPPDYFSETGQRWGNPHYAWDKHVEDEFSWWQARIKTQSMLYDAVRIDHFRGLSAYWEIPAEDPTAINGRWVAAPGKQLLEKLTTTFPDLSFIAEDLGLIDEAVITLRDEFALPGMSILQFAFDGCQDNPYLPKNLKHNMLAYTATHDNDTTLSWYESLNQETKNYVNYCINPNNEHMPWAMIKTVFESVANLAIIPMQDMLGLGQGYRMNTPGVAEGNWTWQFDWLQLNEGLIEEFSILLDKTDRKI